MNIGNLATRRKFTARLFFQRIGAPYLDLGNILLVKQEPKIDRGQQMTARKGFLQVSHEQPAKADLRWSFKLDEQHGPHLRLLNLAKEETVSPTFTQTAANNVTFVGAENGVSVNPGTYFNIGYQRVSNVTFDAGVENVDFSLNRETGDGVILSNYFYGANLDFIAHFDVPPISSPATEGDYSETLVSQASTIAAGTIFFTANPNVKLGSVIVDLDTPSQHLATQGVQFEIDEASGKITILQNMTFFASLTVQYLLVADGTSKSYRLLSEAFVRGTARLQFYDEHLTGLPREIQTFPAEIKVADWGDSDGQKNQEFSLELLATSTPVTSVIESAIILTGQLVSFPYNTTAGNNYQLQIFFDDEWTDYGDPKLAEGDSDGLYIDSGYPTVRVVDLGPAE